MPRLLLEKPEHVKLAEALGLDAALYPKPDEMFHWTPSGKFIVMFDSGAHEAAQALALGGVDDKRVEWIDGSEVEGGIRAVLGLGVDEINREARDLYFDEIRTLRYAEDDETTAERIHAGPNWSERNIKFRRRELVVVAGPYGCGKSTLMQYLGFHWCRGPGALYEADHECAGDRREIPVWFCTWEDDPAEQHNQAERFCKSHLRTEEGHKHLTSNELLDMVLFTRPEFSRDRDLGWYVERARYMNGKYGTNYFILDPWSEFDHIMEPGEQETQYVKKVMKELGKLSVELNAVFVVVTHITKSKYADDMGVRPFRVADSMGSVQFGSSATRGLCVLRTSALTGLGDHMVVYFDKVKIERNMGKAREIIALGYDEGEHSLIEEVDATMEVARLWGCNGGGLCEGKRPDTGDSGDKKNGKTTELGGVNLTLYD